MRPYVNTASFFLYVGDPEIFVIHGTHGGHGDFS